MSYNHQEVEAKWQKYWDDNQTFKTDVWDFSKPKYYVLDMFPYPSGSGLHVGHPAGYTGGDIRSRMKRMQGFNVLHPMGFDAFGLPAEQYAIKTGNHPGTFTQENIEVFTKQLKLLGYDYDWSRQVSTADPKFYKWTQWIFGELYKDGLAKYVDMPVNWCEELGTVLSNDEIIDGLSERGGHPVVKKNMKQWIIDIPKYAERLLEGLETIDWPSSTKEMQRNWIGKSVGATVRFDVAATDKSFEVFTTRPDTLFGSTYCVLAPEHELVEVVTTKEQSEAVKEYQKMTARKSDLERTELNKDKSGVFTGGYAINPANGKEVPIWISDYVLVSYGTGAIMAVPAHDERDYEFATKFGLDIIKVLDGDISETAFTGDAVHVNSDFLDGLGKDEGINKMIEWLVEKEIGEKSVNYRLREWIFARQRYWGEPVPVIHMEDGTKKVLSVDELPLELPEMDEYLPKVKGAAPLENAPEWFNVEIDGVKGKRETTTMPGSAGSSWYHLRYIDPTNENEIADKELMKHWLPVDFYAGGSEHTVGHLLYSRMWNNFLFDKGIVPVKEPYQQLFHQGMILGENNEKMSKSKGNVINPDQIIESHGTDALRLYIMFMGPLESSKPWNSKGVDGSRRFIDRVVRMMETKEIIDGENKKLEKVYHQTVKKVSEDFENIAYNTAISQMMIFVNECYKEDTLPREYAEGFIKMLNPIAPHITEEIWTTILGHEQTISFESWPTYDESKLIEDTVQIIVQVNGKLRAKINVKRDEDKAEVEKIALAEENVINFTEGKTIRKVIVVPNKIVNIVV